MSTAELEGEREEKTSDERVGPASNAAATPISTSNSEENASSAGGSSNAPTSSKFKLEGLSRSDLIAVVKKQHVMLNNKRKEVEELKEELKVKDESIGKLKQESKKTASADMMSMELSDYKRSLEKTKEQLRSVEEDNLRKDEHLKELTNKFVTATEERDNALQELEKSKRELADLKTMLDEKSLTISENSKEINGLVQQIRGFKSEMESEIKRLAEKNVECERQIIEHKRTDLSKMAETKKRSEELTHLQCRYDTLQEEYRQYKVRAEYILKQVKSDEVDGIGDPYTKVPTKFAEVQELLNAIKTKNEKINEMTTKCSLLNDELQLSKQHIVGLEEQLDATNQLLLSAQSSESRERQKQTADFERRLMEREAEVTKLEADRQRLSAKVDEVTQSLNKLEESRQRSEAQNAILQEEIAKLRAEVKDAYSTVKSQLHMSNNDQRQRLPSTHKSPDMCTASLCNAMYNNKSPLPNTLQHALNSNHNNNDNVYASSENSESEDEDLSLQSVINNLDHDCHESNNFNKNVGNDDYNWRMSDVSTLNDFARDEADRSALEAENQQLQAQLKYDRELLADVEETNAKLGAQVALLKEEIRRLERNAERAVHIANNSEYLKNIVMKFLAPQRVRDERRQMLPALATILRLSDAERAQVDRWIESAELCVSGEDSGGVGAANNSSSRSATSDGGAASEWTKYIGSLTGIF